MIIDRDLMFSDKQAVRSTSSSTGTLDLGASGDAVGQELTIHAVVGTAFAGCTSLQVAVETSDTAASGFTTVVSGAVVPVANLTAGKEVFCVRVPQGLKRFTRLAYTVVGTGTAGAITAFASKDL